MKGYILLLASHRASAQSCGDSSCLAEETTLLQGWQQHVASHQHHLGHAPTDGLLNHNQQCWHSNQCGGQGGYCPSFCGTGRCCRAGHVYSDREREECGEEGFGLPNMHTCQPPAEPEEPQGLLNHNQQCWHSNQCGGQGGYCPSFCGTGRCCRAGHVYSDREREECGEGGFGLPNMHTCQPPAEPEEPQADDRLTAYWEAGNCGPHGNDYNARTWCGGVSSDTNGIDPYEHCREEVETDICDSGIAELVDIQGTGRFTSVTINGCAYAYYAQYQCAEPAEDEAELVRGGPDGSCPKGTVRVSPDDCPTTDGQSLTDGTVLSNSRHRVDCAGHFVAGEGCFVNVHGNVYSTAADCAAAEQLTPYWADKHFAVCVRRRGMGMGMGMMGNMGMGNMGMGNMGMGNMGMGNMGMGNMGMGGMMGMGMGAPGADEYVGCFVDDRDRDLGQMVGNTNNAETNTFELCRAACGDSRYMSLQYGGECFCADSYGNGDQYVQVDDAECNRVVEPCSSNSHNCGGTWRQAIYEINVPGENEYIGCFVDDRARDLGQMVGNTNNAETNTFELCRAACGDSRYMSLQYGGECFCADSYGNGDQYVQVDDAECNRVVEPCSSNSHNCGGTWRQAIYEINVPGENEYIGCFVDDRARDLGQMVGNTNNAETNTFELCRAACGNSRYMSLQYGGECFCADSYGNGDQYVQVDDSECNRVVEPCSSNSHNCGGTWRQAIYEINDPPVYDCDLSAYWEFGNCGCNGNDFNQRWCGGIGNGDCPQTVSTDACPSGTARLAEFHGLGGVGATRGAATNWNHEGCEYIWHAQYVCVEAVTHSHELVHDGHCAGGWMGGNTYQVDQDACADHCRATEGCGFFAFCDNGPSGCDGRTTCALYTAAGGCPDDNNWGAYNAYALTVSAVR